VEQGGISQYLEDLSQLWKGNGIPILVQLLFNCDNSNQEKIITRLTYN